MNVSLDPAVDSRRALRGIFNSCSMEKCAWSMLRLRGLPELFALGIWTLFHQSLASDRHVAAVSGLHEKCFSPCLTREGRWRGRQES